MSLNFSLLSKAFKSLSDENRLRILYCLKDNQLSVSKIAEDVQLSQPLVSHHLKVLKESYLIKTERQGAFVYYQLTNHGVIGIIDNLKQMLTKHINNDILI